MIFDDPKDESGGGPVIRRLAAEVIDRIAAGEVIERPASVVKELVENAVDAGASLIEVVIEDGGLSRITVTDDGVGMGPADLQLAVERHATSKLTRAEDLFAIRTLGFRGEALSSIAAVSRLTLTSRRVGDEAGWRLQVDGGRIGPLHQVGAPVGTSLDVQNLFFNTPARRKFMRAPATEQAHVAAACVRVALGSARCGLVLLAGERRLLDIRSGEEVGGDARLRSVVRQSLGDVLAVDEESGGYTLRGWLATPASHRGDRKAMWILLNGRYVRDPTLQRAVTDAHGAALPRGRYPICVLDVGMSPDVVDVNVHPQKLEVRLADGPATYRAVTGMLGRAIGQARWTQAPQGGLIAAGVSSRGDAAAPWAATDPRRAGGGALFPAMDAPSRPPLPGSWRSSQAPEPGRDATVGPSLFGAVGRCLWVMRGRQVEIIDRSAWQARRCYERLRGERAAGAVVSMALLFPEVIDVSGPAAAFLERAGEGLLAWGFEIEAVGPDRHAVRAIPAAVGSERCAERLARDVLALWLGGGPDLQERWLRCCAHHAGAAAAALAADHVILQEIASGDGLDLDGEPLRRLVGEAELLGLLRRG